MTTWTEAKTPRTAAQFRDDFLAQFSASTVRGWSDDAPQRALIEGESAAMEAERNTSVALASTASPETCIAAGSSWVDAVMSFFQLVNQDGSKGRLLATKGKRTLTLIVTPAASPQTVGSANASGIIAQADNGALFVCSQQASVTLSASSTPTAYQATVEFTQRTAGTVGNAPHGTIKKLIVKPAGLDILQTNDGGIDTVIVAPRDDEADQAFVNRGLAKWGLIGPSPTVPIGTAGWISHAFDYLIPYFGNDGATVAVTDWDVDDSNPNGPGTVQVAIANATGPATALEVSTVSAGLNGLAVKPVGSGALTVIAAPSYVLTINATITVDGTFADAQAQVNAAMALLGTRFPMGFSKLEPDLVIAVLRGATIGRASVISGAGHKTFDLDVPGFPSVMEVTALDFVAPVTLARGNKLVLTSVVTVLGL